MIAIIIGVLCILLVWQILKIILKKGIINKNITDYALEYIVFIIILIALFMQESISRNSLSIIALLGIIYEIISITYMYFRYYKKGTITDFSIKKVIDECEFGILVLKGKKAKLINKYHDILGQNLSILQQYLNKEKISQENFEEIKFMVQKMFIDIEDTDDTNTNLENLIKIHKKNGTDIIMDGKLPQNKETAKEFFEIIREATTNAIRHAGSSKVFVKTRETLEETYMIITNDGRKPNKFITENQGIKDMRRKVKKLGGMFYISTVPEFSVNISIKNNC